MGPTLLARERASAVDPRHEGDRSASPRANGPPTWWFVALVALGCGLRVWRALHNGASFDESFTAMAARRPLGDLVDYLATHDSHPPLDYLLRMPFARAGAGDVWLRAPSIVFSCAALALFAWWMHRRSWFGLLATALFAVSTFQVLHGGEARMYALLQLLGVATAVVAARWLHAPQPWHAWTLGSLTLLALFDHVSGLLLGLGLLALAGLRRDRDAWRLRVAVAAAGALWTALWLPTVVEQLRHDWSSWVPRTSPSGFARAVGEQVVTGDGTTWVVFAAAVVGGVVLVRRDAVLGRLWLALGAVPFAAAAVIGLASAFLLPRTLTLASWAPIVAVAALLDAARRRWHTAGTVAAILVPVLVLAATSTFFAVKVWDYDLSVAQLERVAQPGDVIAVRPARYGILLDWRIEVLGPRLTRDVDVAIPDSDARQMVGAPRSGRIWLLTPVGDRTRFDGFTSCAPRWDDGVTTVRCLR